MLTVFMPDDTYNPTLFNHQHSLIFDLEKDKFTYSNDPSKCDIAVVLYSAGQQLKLMKDYLYNLGYHGPIVILSLFHIDESHVYDHNDSTVDYFKQHFSNVILIHTNIANKHLHTYYDFLWERQRVYFCEYSHHDLKTRIWTYLTSKDMYVLDSIKLSKNPKKYLAPMRIYYDIIDNGSSKRSWYRQQLQHKLKSYDGFLSDLDNFQIIEPQEYNIDIKNQFQLGNSGGCWWPPHNKYYKKSIASIYVETITQGYLVRSITEKTWDPLIKGHFIIPFGYRGMIEDIRAYGFKLPSWIDYSYDLLDDNERFAGFMNSVDKFLNTDIETLTQLYHQDKLMLSYNRQLFFKATPQTIYDRIVSSLNQ